MANGGWLIPGLIITDSATGQSDVDSSAASQDGKASVANGANIKAVDGILLNNFENRHLIAAFDGGVTSVIASPQGAQLVAGQSAVFYSVPGQCIDDVEISSSASLDIHVGSSISSSGYSSFSSQIAQIRQLFNEVMTPGNFSELQQPFRDVYDRKIPLAVYVNQVDQINTILRLKIQFGFDLIIIGGAEAYLIASKLAKWNVSVILSPVRTGPSLFANWKADDASAISLHVAGVRVGISPQKNDAVRTLRWEAGLILANIKNDNILSFTDVLAMVTKNIGEMYNLRNNAAGSIKVIGSIRENTQANFVIFSENPFTFHSSTLMVAVGTHLHCDITDYK